MRGNRSFRRRIGSRRMKQDLHELRGTCAELTEIFRVAGVSDKRAERNTTIGCVTGFLGFFGFFFGVSIAMEAESPIGWGITVLFLCMTAWGAWFYNKNSKFDIEDDKLELVTRLIPLLQTDTKENQALSVKIDFRPASYETAEFVLEEKALGGSVYGEIKSYKISQKWLELQGRLVDGTAYKLELERLGKSKVKPKKKGRRKVKSRLQERITVSLRPSVARYPDLDKIKEKLPKEPPNSLKVSSLRAEPNQVRATFITPLASKFTYRAQLEEEGWDHIASADNLAGALVYLYRGLKGLKAETIGSGT